VATMGWLETGRSKGERVHIEFGNGSMNSIGYDSMILLVCLCIACIV
jgi:hypothetical protein